MTLVASSSPIQQFENMSELSPLSFNKCSTSNQDFSFFFAFFKQFSPCAEPLSAPLHDTGLDLLCGHDHQGDGVREGGEAEGNHEDHGSGNRNTVA